MAQGEPHIPTVAVVLFKQTVRSRSYVGAPWHSKVCHNPQLSMPGAQLCSIEDVLITGQRFHAGTSGLSGSGGFSTNVAVVGEPC